MKKSSIGYWKQANAGWLGTPRRNVRCVKATRTCLFHSIIDKIDVYQTMEADEIERVNRYSASHFLLI